MLYLGIDSSTMVGSVALLSDEELVGEYTLNLRRTHSERLMLAVESLFATAELAVTDVDYVCVATGPGSYTGVRIGVTTAKALAWSLAKPLVAVGTLEALAWLALPCGAGQIIAPCVAAKGSLVFAAAYEAHGPQGLRELQPPHPVEVGDFVASLAALVKGTDRYVLPMGDGFVMHRSAFDPLRDRGSLRERAASQLLPRASAVAAMGRLKAAQGSTTDPFVLVPEYLRVPEAELALSRKASCEVCEG